MYHYLSIHVEQRRIYSNTLVLLLQLPASEVFFIEILNSCQQNYNINHVGLGVIERMKQQNFRSKSMHDKKFFINHFPNNSSHYIPYVEEYCSIV